MTERADLFCNAATDACAEALLHMDELYDLLVCMLTEADNSAKIRECASDALGVHDEIGRVLSLTANEPADQDEEL